MVEASGIAAILASHFRYVGLVTEQGDESPYGRLPVEWGTQRDSMLNRAKIEWDAVRTERTITAVLYAEQPMSPAVFVQTLDTPRLVQSGDRPFFDVGELVTTVTMVQ